MTDEKKTKKAEPASYELEALRKLFIEDKDNPEIPATVEVGGRFKADKAQAQHFIDAGAARIIL